jgi:hypothetical protein
MSFPLVRSARSVVLEATQGATISAFVSSNLPLIQHEIITLPVVPADFLSTAVRFVFFERGDMKVGCRAHGLRVTKAS